MGFVFGVTAISAVLFSYFFVPECKNRSLEDIDRLFIERVPLRKFPQHVLSIGGDEDLKLDSIKGTVIQEEDLTRA